MIRLTLARLAIGATLVASLQLKADTVTCSSEDGGRNYCSLGSNYGRVRLVRQRSGSPCEEGRSWGTDSRGIWVDHGCRADFDVDRNYSDRDRDDDRRGDGGNPQIVTCSSEDGGRHYCSVSSDYGRIRLGRQRSGSPCEEGRSWGTDSRGIWVDRGCRADFVVEGRRYDRDRDNGRSYDDRDGQTVTCSSEDGGRHYCSIGSGSGRVRLVRQRSGSACDEGRSWGTDSRGIWVDHGCRADFVVEQR